MNADFDSAAWAQHHRSFSVAIDRLIRSVTKGLDYLNRREFEAPWLNTPARRAARRQRLPHRA